MFSGVHHIGYLTDDLESAMSLLTLVFRGEILKRVTAENGNQTVYVKTGSVEVEVIQPGDRARLQGQTGLVFDHVGFFVPNLADAATELQRSGARTSGDPIVTAMGYKLWMLNCDTLLGARIHLTEQEGQVEETAKARP
ncbi:MAG: VOC family protein [Chloroflexota bacterium]